MAVLHAIVSSAVNFLHVAVAEFVHRSVVGAQAVGGDGCHRVMAFVKAKVANIAAIQ
jgi:hypothetical protein